MFTFLLQTAATNMHFFRLQLHPREFFFLFYFPIRYKDVLKDVICCFSLQTTAKVIIAVIWKITAGLGTLQSALAAFGITWLC